ncbi:hypothetical protein P170DRAFT_262249 [Aspergillus steynii IBT 23096]|uniref:Zn(2)-C6 fungal-type domain-containing protein n=1 Tax=Aspergillus steynii IBT 23096 TaxID=1392250 RepID=A0A2I2FZV0_9EURO|nr:uncharacterized protein P170DRAFT_262249 [Aspergillus steynii IBT 23096]PLB46162.1 hypothetical protein P170DRAFT_262249 [Aspergillus steynii IBT 23096]
MSEISEKSGPTPSSTMHEIALRKHLDRKRRHQKPRVLFSCTFCRTRKLKCNRQQPCDNCVKRNQGPSCHYDVERGDSIKSTSDLHDRLKFLEEKVQRLERQSMPEITRPDSRNSGDGHDKQSSHAPGVIFSGHGGTRYVDSGHWRAILNDIEEIGKDRHHAAVADPIDDVDRNTRGLELLIGMPVARGTSELLAVMPPRNTADPLVARYFKSRETSLIFIHTPTFYKEYEAFWEDPLQVSIPWLGILYGVLSCGLWMEFQTDQRFSSLLDARFCGVYRTYCALCLTSCNYTVPGRYKPEALVMYLGNEYLQNPTARSGISMLLSCAVRLAILMGYHRDSRHYPHITTFEGEMRRRLWLFLRVTDAVMARQYGIPAVIQKGHGDTSLPRNLLDEDFGPNTRVLPLPRPEIVTTPIARSLSIERVLAVTGEILHATSSMELLSYDRTIELNSKIDQVRSRLSPAFQMQVSPPATPGVSSPEDVRGIDIALQRYGTEMVLQVARCILLRRYLIDARSETRYDQLRWACLDAARQILHHQLELFQQVIVRAKQHNRVWFSFSHIVSDCLTAAMVICLEVICQIRAKQHVDSDLIHLLQGSHQTWRSSERQTVEVSKAEGILAAMLELIASKLSEQNSRDAELSDKAACDQTARRVETEFPMGLVNDVLAGSDFDWDLWDFEMQQSVSGFPATWMC